MQEQSAAKSTTLKSPVTALRFELLEENSKIGAIIWLGNRNALKRQQLCNEKIEIMNYGEI